MWTRHPGSAPVVAVQWRVGEFYDQEEWKGRAVIVRYQWTDISPRRRKWSRRFRRMGQELGSELDLRVVALVLVRLFDMPRQY